MRLRASILVLVLSVCLAAAQENERPARFVFRAFGDVNLGRSVGQELLKGNIDYPFERVRGLVDGADVVFVNLESQLTDQNGETQSPIDNYMFCGPPEGARSLRNAGINVVSTANNHAYDYGMRALRETIDNLVQEGVRYAGTSQDSSEYVQPVIVEKDGIRIGILAYTEFVNRKGAWQGHISLFSRKRARAEIEAARKLSDIVIVSYHGGTEYTDQPSKLAQSQMRYLTEAGADVVIGHHPHVPQGIEERDGKYIFSSLGNFVFYQPQHFWTQLAIGVELVFERKSERVEIRSVRVIPLRSGKQPTLSLNEEERRQIRERIQRLSNVMLHQEDSTFSIRPRTYE